MKDLKIGDKVWIKSTNRSRTYGEVQECIITKIGRKYLAVNKEGYPDSFAIKFDMTDNMRQFTNYSPDCELYFSKQDILDEEEYYLLLDSIRKVLGNYGKCELTLDQLKKINGIVKDVK